MNAFFEITPEQVDAINDGSRFTQVCNRLIEAEASAAGIPSTVVQTTHKTWDPDGGLDAMVTPPAEHRSGWIPQGESGWQFKIGYPSDSEIQKELQKPNVQALLGRGGTYMLLVGEGRSPDLQQKLETRMNELVASAGLPGKCRALFPQQIARWASDHLSLIMHPEFRTPVGNLQRYEDWSRSRRFQSEYEWDPARIGIRDQLHHDLSGNHHESHVSRIEGGGGIGKTRLALESLRDARFMPIVVYASRPDHIPADLIGYFRANVDRRAILVIDECDSSASEHWERDTDDLNARLQLITIGPLRRVRPGFTVAGYHRVGRLAREALEKVIEREARGLLSRETLLYVQELSSGNVRAALLLVENYREGRTRPPADLARADRNLENMLDSMVGPDPELRRALTGLALLSSVGVDQDLAAEADAVANFIGLDPARFRALVVRGEHAGVVEFRGRQRYVSPEILAISLAGEFWAAHSRRIADLYRQLPPGAARERFLERLVSLGDDPNTRSTVKELLKPGPLFHTIDDLNNRELGKVLQNLAMADPESAASLIETLLEGREPDDLKRFNGGRRALVWTLEKLAWLPETFPAAARSLLALAEAETERYSNNATGMWKQLFHLQLSGTATPIAARLDLLEELLSSPGLSADRRKLVHDALAEVFSRHLIRSISVVSLRGQPLPDEYSPRTVGEVRGAAQRALGILWREASGPHAEAARYARMRLLENLAEIAAFGLASELVPILESPTWAEWNMEAELVRGIDDALSVADERWSENVRQRLLEIRNQRLDASVGAQLRRWLGKPGPADWRGRDDPELAADVNAKRLADQVFRAPGVIDPHWSWIVSPEAQRAWPFGFRLGELDGERSWEPRMLEEARADRGTGLWSGYLAGRRAAGDGAWVDAHLEELVTTESLGPAIVQALLRQEASEHAGRLVLRLLTTGKIDRRQLSSLQYGGWIGQLSEAVAYEIFEAALDRASAVEVSHVLELYGMRLHRNIAEVGRHEEFVWRLLEAGIAAAGTSHDDWLWQHIAQTVVEKDPMRAARIVLTLFQGSDPGQVVLDSDHRIQVLQGVLNTRPDEVWPEVGEILLKGNVNSYRLRTALGTEVVKSLPLEILEAWVREHGERAAVVLAELMKPETVPLDSHVRMLLRNFGDSDKVTNALARTMIERVYSGPTSLMLRHHVDRLKQWEQDGDSTVRNWARKVRRSFEEQIAFWEPREQEEE